MGKEITVQKRVITKVIIPTTDSGLINDKGKLSTAVKSTLLSLGDTDVELVDDYNITVDKTPYILSFNLYGTDIVVDFKPNI